jgi:hypothetical protein
MPFSPGRTVNSPIPRAIFLIPFTTVSPILLIRIVREGIARRDQNTKNDLPELDWGK